MHFQGGFLHKRGQITLFIIISVLIVAAVVLFFSLKPDLQITGKVTDPSSFIEKCMKDSASEALDIIGRQGGSLNPNAYALSDNEKIGFLCYTNQYYTKCVNQRPLMKYDIEADVTSYVRPNLQQCVSDLKDELEKQGYSVDVGALKLSTSLEPKRVIVDAQMPLTVTKEDSSRYENYEAIVLSPMYEQVFLAQEIANSEVRVGDFDQVSYMLFNPDSDIEKTTQGENVIYTLKDRPTEKRFYFAVRSYVMPPGL